MTASDHPNQFALLGQRRFGPFFWVQFLGAGNDNLFKFAFTVLVTYQLQVAWLRLHGYEPTTLHLSAFKRLGARVMSANIAFDDHPNEKRFADRIETVTVDSVFAWLNRSGLGGPVQVIR